MPVNLTTFTNTKQIVPTTDSLTHTLTSLASGSAASVTAFIAPVVRGILFGFLVDCWNRSRVRNEEERILLCSNYCMSS